MEVDLFCKFQSMIGPLGSLAVAASAPHVTRQMSSGKERPMTTGSVGQGMVLYSEGSRGADFSAQRWKAVVVLASISAPDFRKHP